MNKILITGAAGLLGANIMYLLRNQNMIFGLDRNEIKMPNSITLKLELNEINTIEELISKNSISTLIHCAAMTKVDDCEILNYEAYKSNFLVTKDLLSIAMKYNMHFIFISSDAVFDGSKIESYEVDDFKNPLNYYGHTKSIAEDLVLKYNLGLVLRTNIYGFNYRNKSSFSEWIYDSLENGLTLKMIPDVKFSPILVNEFIKYLQHFIDSRNKGIFHLASSGCTNKFEFAMELKKIFELEGEIIRANLSDFDFKAKRSKNMCLNIEKTETFLGLKINDFKTDLLLLKSLHDSGYSDLLKKSN